MKLTLYLLMLQMAVALVSQSLQDTVKLQDLMDQADYYSDRNFDSCYLYSQKAVSLAKAIGNDKWLGHAYNTHGDYFLMKTEIDSGIFYYKKAKGFFEKSGYIRGELDTMNGIGSMLYNGGNYQEALDYLIEALTRLQKGNYSFDQLEAALMINVAQVYQNLKNYEKSNEYNQASLEILQRLGNGPGVASAMGNMAFNLIEMEEYEQALEVANEAKQIFGETDLIMGVGACNYVIGKSYRNLQDFEKAETILLEALGQLRSYGDPYLTILTLIDLGRLYNEIDQLEKAELHLEEALSLAKENTLKPELIDIFHELSTLYEKSGAFDKALFYTQEHFAIQDSLFNEKISAQMAEMESKYQSDRKQQLLEIQDQQLAKEATLRNALIGGVVLVLIISGLIYRNQRLKTKALSEKEALLKEIHHRVKNNLQVISSLLNMQSRGTEDEGMKEAIREGQARVKAMSLIHQKLYQNENISEIDFEDYSQQLLSQLDAVYKKAEKQVKHAIDVKGISLDIDTAVPLGLILNELISNAYKYAFDDVDEGELKITLERTDDKHLQLEVADNGIGLPADFNIDTAKSLGLKLVNILTKQLKGTLQIERGTGTRFLIQFSEINPKVA
ncbi:tetratricopeptide repeat protein [Ekhidna sp.]|uniref:tetratricopeptide repeat protein n=1 Tax=Ekhidna sp. TaxID=2608089 RepID=UPI003B58DDA9